MSMVTMKSFFVLIFLILLSIPIISVNAHSMFNSGESTIGNHRVQIATIPEIPATGDTAKVLFRITDHDLNEVERFTMGIRIFFNDVQIDAIHPELHEGAHWEMDFKFDEPGNHIFKVDMYDMAKDGGVITHTFNIGTHSPFGYIFIYSISAGTIGLAVLLAYIYLPKRLRAKS